MHDRVSLAVVLPQETFSASRTIVWFDIQVLQVVALGVSALAGKHYIS